MESFIRGKPLLLIVLALLVISAAACAITGGGGKVSWLTDWNETLSKAQAENKPIMIDFYGDFCPICWKLDRETFSDEELSDFLNDNFICLRSNTGKSSLHESYGIPGVPTIVFASPEGKEISRIVGYKSPNEFYHYALAALNQWKH